MTSRIPPLLQPYIHVPPPGSLTLLTSVLGASANWLIIRYLSAALNSNGRRSKNNYHAAHHIQEQETIETDDVAVVLVSWLRDWEFWKTEARRAGGLDLARLHQQGRFTFVDGLTHLFSSAQTSQETKTPAGPTLRTPEAPRTSLPLHRNTPPRTPPGGAPPEPPSLPSISTSLTPTPTPTHPIHLTFPTLSHLTTTLLTSISNLKSAHILLILDTPSLLLHTTLPPITATALTTTILHLRSHVDSTVLALPADMPLSCTGTDVTPLEADNAAFLVGMAHQSRLVMGCRRLGTGWADDISGVLRVTRGGGDGDGEEVGAEGEDGPGGVDVDEAKGSAAVVEEGEWLYHIGGDGTAKVWSRGSGDG